MNQHAFARPLGVLVVCVLLAFVILPLRCAHVQGTFAAGDFHNHTTCSDGSISMRKLIDQSASVFGLDWFVQSEHGGSFTRNCTLAEEGPSQTWESTIGRA